ncbi:MAG: tetratricopeptide repeat protein [Thermoanaerobaculia bacterium]|nr:tetratricopeptide repeat protein [Thermoanaerobaculia bacterium]
MTQLSNSYLRPMMSPRAFRVAISFALLMFLAVSGWAASQGRIAGTVKDQDGKPLEGVTVTVRGLERDTLDTYTTNKKGKFTAIVVDASLSHAISLELEGYESLVDKPLDIGIGNNPLGFVMAKGASTPTGAKYTGGPSPEAAAVFNAGADAARAGDLVTAQAKFEEVLTIDPDLVQAHSALAGIYLEGEEYQKAANAADKALLGSPDDSRLLNLAYEAYKGLGNEAHAAELLARIKELGAGGDAAIVIFNEGAGAAQAGDLATAIAKFEEALEINPELDAAYGGLAMTHLGNGDYQEAADYSEKWLERQPGIVRGLQARYDAYRLLGDEAKTQMAFDEFAAASPAMLTKALQDQANEAFNMNQIDTAKGLAEKILSVNPEHPRGHYILGLCLVNKGDSAGAKMHLEKFAALAPTDPDAAGAAEMAKSL